MRGKGDYYTDTFGKPTTAVGQAARGLGKYVGGGLGSLFGKREAGAGVGGAALQSIARLFGHGDYGTAPAGNSIVTGQSVASFQNGGRGLRITHREFITNVTASNAFTLSSYPINPAMPQTFPFLAQIARLFEEYEFEGLVFQYVPSSGMVTASSPALGTVIMATDYDSYAADFLSKQEMESYEFAISTVPYTGAAHGVECARGERTKTNLYTRTGTAKGSLLDYDFGKFQIATVGCPSSYVCGELWVTYDVRLLKPRLPRINVVPRIYVSDLPSVHPNWLGVSVKSDPNPGIVLNTSGYPVPFFNMARPFTEWSGEPVGYSLTSDRIYILRKSSWAFRIEYVCQDPGYVGRNAYAVLTSGTVNEQAGYATSVFGAKLSVGASGFQTDPRDRFSQASGSAYTGPISSGKNGCQYNCNVTALSDWSGLGSFEDWGFGITNGWQRAFGPNAVPIANMSYYITMSFVMYDGSL